MNPLLQLIPIDLFQVAPHYRFRLVPRCRSSCHANYSLRLDLHAIVTAAHDPKGKLQVNVSCLYPFLVC